MLQKITFKKYLLASVAILLTSYAYQISKHQECAWDGCFVAQGNTYVGSLFGLPAFLLWPISFVGLLLFTWKALAKARR